jgi:hypothetical protein
MKMEGYKEPTNNLLILKFEDEGIIFLRNAGGHMPDNTSSFPRGQNTS